MLYYRNNKVDPAYNLALEEALLKTTHQFPVLLFWQNANTIVIGRNQNPSQEIFLSKANQDQVHLVRRLSGGGTVYQDLGNLCFTFIQRVVTQPTYDSMINPIIDALRSLGVNATFSGKNDICIDGLKISGNAQYRYEDLLLHHGTLLFDVELTKLKQYLRPNYIKMKSKGISSKKAQVTNIKPYLPANSPIQTTKQFKDYLEKFMDEHYHVEVVDIPRSINASVGHLATLKYRQNSWNLGRALPAEYKNSLYFTGKGLVSVRLNLQHNLITTIQFTGDFLGTGPIYDLEAALENVPFTTAKITAVLERFDLEQLFGVGFQVSDFIELLFDPHWTES